MSDVQQSNPFESGLAEGQVDENTDLDVDVDTALGEDEVDTIPADGGTAEAPADKGAKTKKESTRPPVPEGKVSPVAFAKILTDHLRQDHPELGVRLPADKEVRPQVVYSYIKNNPAGSKNPFPTHEAPGRAVVLDPQEALNWWDEKDRRVTKGKQERAAKAAAKAEKDAAKDTTTEAEATEPASAVVEAE